MLKRTQTWKKYTTAALVGAVVTNMCFAYTTKYKGEREWHVGVQEREQEREWIIPFPKFGNGKGIEKTHSLNSGTGREWKKTIPKIREWEGNEKIYSQNSGTGREWKKSIPTIREREGNEKNPFPQFGNGNQRLSFPRIPGNGNEKT